MAPTPPDRFGLTACRAPAAGAEPEWVRPVPPCPMDAEKAVLLDFLKEMMRLRPVHIGTW
jgi:hypothetical protein